MNYLLMEKRQKIKSLEAIRAIAFVAVCLSHSEIKTFCSMGHWATSIFLILSGFVTALSTSSKTIKPSFKKISNICTTE